MKIKEFYKRYDSLLIHSTRLNGGAGAGLNKCIDQNATTSERIKKVKNIKSTISCCSFSHGDGLKNIFGPIGVFLNGGDIIAANEFDLGSYLNEQCERKCEPQGISVSQQVSNAIKNRERWLWNEFLIKNHRVFGIFICMDDVGYAFTQAGEFNAFYNSTKKFLLPYFIIHTGNVYKAKFDNKKDVFIPTTQLSIGDIKRKYCTLYSIKMYFYAINQFLQSW